MKEYLKSALYLVFGVTAMSVILVLCMAPVAYMFKQEQEEKESILGKNYILEGDTLKVIDYSDLNNNYTLSNGANISIKLIDSTNTF